MLSHGNTRDLESWEFLGESVVLNVGDTELRKLGDLGEMLLYQLIYDRLKGVRNLG